MNLQRKHEGPEAFQRFDATVKSLLSVSHELIRRAQEYKQAALNARKRGLESDRRAIAQVRLCAYADFGAPRKPSQGALAESTAMDS